VESARRAAKAAVESSTCSAKATAISSTATSKASTATKAATTSVPTSETAAKATTETTAAAKATATAEAAATATLKVVGEPIFANFERTTLEFVSVELVDRIHGVVWRFKNDDARALWTAIRTNVNIGTNNVAFLGCMLLGPDGDGDRSSGSAMDTEKHTCLAEQVLQILPSYRIR
jgi:hypothetical protein